MCKLPLFIPSLEEDRLLVSYSFLRMLLLLLGGGIVNAFFLAYYGITFQNITLTLGSDWRVFLAWLLSYPILWAVGATYLLPNKFRVSPNDLSIVTSILLIPIYLALGKSWIPLTLFNGYALFAVSVIETFFVGSIVGYGKAGGLPYYYDSFLLEGKTITDFRRIYDLEQYRDWLSLPNLQIEPRGAVLSPTRIILSSSSHDKTILFVFFSNHNNGLLVQIISFEKGKYFIFKSKNAIFVAEQIKRVVLWELQTSPIPFEVEPEREGAEKVALRVTQSIATVRELERRDRIVLSAGIALLILEYLLWAFNVISSTDNYVGYSILTGFGIIAELSYRRLRQTKIWERIAGRAIPTSSP
jgi:hypothetical protein